jgi:hypothetical protein
MRKLIFAGLILTLGSAAFTQANDTESTDLSDLAPWQLVVYDVRQMEAAEEEVSGYIEEGYIPVGFEVEPGKSLSILLVRSGGVPIDGWVMTDYENWDELEARVSGTIQHGFVPMDISRAGEGIAILWVKTPMAITSWRLHREASSAANQESVIRRFGDQGFSLWGVSETDNEFWFLFLKLADQKQEGAIAFMENDLTVFRDALESSREEGWLPNGLALNDESFYVSFIRPEAQ